MNRLLHQPFSLHTLRRYAKISSPKATRISIIHSFLPSPLPSPSPPPPPPFTSLNLGQERCASLLPFHYLHAEHPSSEHLCLLSTVPHCTACTYCTIHDLCENETSSLNLPVLYSRAGMTGRISYFVLVLSQVYSVSSERVAQSSTPSPPPLLFFFFFFFFSLSLSPSLNQDQES